MFKIIKYFIYSVILIVGINYACNRYEVTEADLTQDEVNREWEKEKEEVKKESKELWYKVKEFIIKLKKGKIVIK